MAKKSQGSQTLKNTKKPMGKKTKKLLRFALAVFGLSLLLFLFIMMKYRIKADLVWIMFFLYGALYAGWFYVCVTIAHKLKSLKFGIIMFLIVLILAFGAFWYASATYL